jgi:hypothetical protein
VIVRISHGSADITISLTSGSIALDNFEQPEKDSIEKKLGDLVDMAAGLVSAGAEPAPSKPRRKR